MIQIPLTQIGSPEQFANIVEAHRKALHAHMMGPPGKPAPRSSEWVEAVIRRIPADGPVETRGPDKFVVLPYEIVDDRPKDQEQISPAIQLLRETIQGS